MAMRMHEAAEMILAGRKAAERVGKEFVVDRDKLARFGGFSKSEMDAIDAAVASIEEHRASVIAGLKGD